MQFKIALLRRVESLGGRIQLEDVIRQIGRHWRFKIWNLPINAQSFRRAWTNTARPNFDENALTFKEAVCGIVQCYAAEVGNRHAKVWVDHTPGNVRHWHRLLDEFPEARLIHIVRDGRGVAASILPLDWGPNSVWDAAHWWPEWLAYGLAAEIRNPERVLRIHYEELLLDPQRLLARVCSHVGLEPTTGLGSATDFRIPRYTREQHRLANYPPDPSRADAWKQALKARQVEVFESSAGDLLKSLNYDLEFGGRAKRPAMAEKLTARVQGSLREGLNHLRHAMRAKMSAR